MSDMERNVPLGAGTTTDRPLFVRMCFVRRRRMDHCIVSVSPCASLPPCSPRAAEFSPSNHRLTKRVLALALRSPVVRNWGEARGVGHMSLHRTHWHVPCRGDSGRTRREEQRKRARDKPETMIRRHRISHKKVIWPSLTQAIVKIDQRHRAELKISILGTGHVSPVRRVGDDASILSVTTLCARPDT